MSKETLAVVIENIKKATRLSQGQISVQAGLEQETLAQLKAKERNGKVDTSAAIKKLKIAFKDALNKSTSPEEITTAKQDILEKLLKLAERIDANLENNIDLSLTNNSFSHSILFRLAEQDARELKKDPMGIFQASVEIAKKHYNATGKKYKRPGVKKTSSDVK